jgi:hypothetical protein
MFGPYTPDPCQRCGFDTLVTIITNNNAALHEKREVIVTWHEKDCGELSLRFCAHCGQMQGDFPKHFLLDYFK